MRLHEENQDFRLLHHAGVIRRGEKSKKIVLIRVLMYGPAAARLVIAQQINDFVHYFVFGHDRPLLSSPKIRTGNGVTGRGVSACTYRWK